MTCSDDFSSGTGREHEDQAAQAADLRQSQLQPATQANPPHQLIAPRRRTPYLITQSWTEPARVRQIPTESAVQSRAIAGCLAVARGPLRWSRAAPSGVRVCNTVFRLRNVVIKPA